MPTMEDIHVDPTTRAGEVTSPVSDPTVSSPHHPAATEGIGAAKAYPSVLSGVYDYSKVQDGVYCT